MSTYLAYFKIAFKNNTVYRVEWILGIINTCLQIFISCAIWKVLYGGNTEVNGVAYAVIVTNFVISQGLSEAFSTNDFALQRKLRDGSIANELLKPIDYRHILLANNLGNIVFKLISNFLPSFVIMGLYTNIIMPVSISAMFLFIVSVIFGFAILWSISLIVQMTAFWIMNVWSISTIKNVVIKILAGSAIPLWFMPKPILEILKYTPFESIYYIPMKIYFGEIASSEVALCLAKQALWFFVLYFIGIFLWNKGRKKIILQGG